MRHEALISNCVELHQAFAKERQSLSGLLLGQRQETQIHAACSNASFVAQSALQSLAHVVVGLGRRIVTLRGLGYLLEAESAHG